MTVAWISDTDYHKFFRTLSLNFSKNYCSFEKLYPKLHSVFHPISRHLEVGLQKLGCASIFNPILGVWISDETLRVVLDILLPYFLVFRRCRSFPFLLCSWYHCRWSCVRSPFNASFPSASCRLDHKIQSCLCTLCTASACM